MEAPTQPTFIPHEAVGTPVQRRGGGGLSELALLIAVVLLIISGALAGGVFLYAQYLRTSTQSKLGALQQDESEFEPSLIEQLTRLDDRMNSASTLLAAHLAPTEIFTMLEASTIQDISFTSLKYDATNPQRISLTMSGVAGSVNSIALEAQVFSQTGILTSPIFSNIDREKDGVHFDFSALVNPSAISYEGFVSAAAKGASTSTAPTQTNASAAQGQGSASTPAASQFENPGASQ